MRPYFITGYPRSRSAWLSVAMTRGPSVCLFEPFAACGALRDLDNVLGASGAEFCGASDTTMLLFATRVTALWPHAPIVLVERDQRDAMESCRKCGFGANKVYFEDAAAGFNYLRGLPQTLTVPFVALSKISNGEAIWEHCVPGTRFPTEHWRALDDLNIQVRFAAEQEKITRLSSAARHFFGGQSCTTGIPLLH